MKKMLSLVLAILVVATTFVGCGKPTSSATANITDVDYKFNEEALKVSDSSDLPDWTGKEIDLTMWYATGSYSLKKNKISSDDVVTPEIKRVTGVQFSEDSFDNNGDMMDAKIAKIIATKELPDVIWGGQANVINQLIDEDMLWDLTELIPAYMPNLHALMEKGEFMKSKREDGKIYEIRLAAPFTYAFPEVDPALLSRISAPNNSKTGCVYVRDDILKMIKPEAYTQDELIAKFNANGGFTEEEVLNASFNSKEEFYQFLRDVKALGLKSGNREVYATYAFTGSDNWDFMLNLAGTLNGFCAFPTGSLNDYFTYFDVETGKIEIMYEQEWYKEAVKELLTLIQEGVISEDSLIDNTASFQEKCQTGQYAVLYGGTAPNINTLNENSKGYKYRKVIINVPYNENKFIPMRDQFSSGTGYAFVKSEISEDEIAQVLRYFDFMLTDVGQKLYWWGPRSAGLFEETENGRRYTVKEIEQCAVYGEANDAVLKYGLANNQWPGYPSGTNKWDPRLIYDLKPNLNQMNHNFYTTALFDPMELVQSKYARIYSGEFQSLIPDVARFWSARTAFETDFTKVLTAKNDAEFDALWKTMVDNARRNGMTEETLAEINNVWVNVENKDYIQNVEEYLKKHNSKLNVAKK